MKNILPLLLFVLLFFSACEESLEQTGTIKYIELEGGFYGISGDDGKNYDPVNLPQQFKEDNIRVRFKFRYSENQVSFHQWGTLIEILEIERI